MFPRLYHRRRTAARREWQGIVQHWPTPTVARTRRRCLTWRLRIEPVVARWLAGETLLLVPVLHFPHGELTRTYAQQGRAARCSLGRMHATRTERGTLKKRGNYQLTTITRRTVRFAIRETSSIEYTWKYTWTAFTRIPGAGSFRNGRTSERRCTLPAAKTQRSQVKRGREGKGRSKQRRTGQVRRHSTRFAVRSPRFPRFPRLFSTWSATFYFFMADHGER